MKYIYFFSALFFSFNLYALDCSVPHPTQSIEFLQCTFGCEPGVECDRFAKSMQRDSKRNCKPLPDDVWDLNKFFPELEKKMTQVRGKVYYGGIVGGQYGYWLYSRKKHLIFHTTIHFSNWDAITKAQQVQLQKNFDQAARIWKNHNHFDFPVQFVFRIVTEPRQAHIKNVKLMKKTRGPYFDKWNINWTPYTIAHEFGHIMGLDDEYSYFQGGTEGICDESSFMCKSHGDKDIKNYHYYMVARRFFCD